MRRLLQGVELFVFLSAAVQFVGSGAAAQVSTAGFANLARPEPPGTLLSHPVANGSEPIGRTTSLNYLNGWLVVGGESPGSRPGSDLVLRVYDIEDPTNPIRRYPSDFNLSYPGDRWYQGNVGWLAHGTAQSGSLLLPQVLQVSSHGAPVELGGTNGIPDLGQVPVGYDRSSQAGPWDVNSLWYGTPDQDIRIQQVTLNQWGYTSFNPVASFDHVGLFGGGDWHSMIFGDLLVMARSGTAAHDGVVVYRLEYLDFDDPNPAMRRITPHLVGSLAGGFQGYWPNLFSDGTSLYVIGSNTDILIAADIGHAASPSGDGSVTLAASLTIPGFTNASYPVYQDQFGFIHNRKIDMTRFLAGDANPIVLTLNEQESGVDTSQMSLPLGNLWLTGGYPHGSHSQGMGVWVHQQEPDLTPPRVAYHIPQANRTQYPRHAPLSFLLHEHPRHGGPRNGIDFAVRPVLEGDTLGPAVQGFLIHDFSGALTFTPAQGLEPETTYQVDFFSDPAQQIGFVDAASNYIEPYSFRFSTGGGLNAPALPTIEAVIADPYQPLPGQAVSVQVVPSGDGPFETRFNFDGTWGPWGEIPEESYVFTHEGRPRVLVQIRDTHGAVVTGSVRLLVLNPPAGPSPTQSSSIVVGDDPGGRRVWLVNPDADSVAVLDAATGQKMTEHPVGSNPRNVAKDGLGRYWVSCQGSDELYVLNADGGPAHTISLPYGSAPFGVVASPDGAHIFVSLYGSAQVQRYNASAPLSPPVSRSTFPSPRALAVSSSGEHLFVTRFISPPMHGEIGELAALSPGLDWVRTISLSSSNTIDGGDRSAGVPNYLAAIAISPREGIAAVASKQDNVQRGTLFGVGDLTHETTVRAVVSFVDLQTGQELRDTRRDFDNADSPSALSFSPLGDTLFTALQGKNLIAGIDALNLAPVVGFNTAGSTETSPAVVTMELGAGLAPQGLLIDSHSMRLITQDFMGRSATVRDAAPFLLENRTSLPLIASIPTVSAELLSPDVLLGKQIFYNAADPRMSADGYISCASCHIDGGSDSRVWDFSGRGEGLRRTTDLRGRSGMGHGNVHWSANFDEIQDFEHDIRGPFGGSGFLPISPQNFAVHHPSPATGKTGLSPELDALAAYVASLGPASVPRSPHRTPAGAITQGGLRGRDVFDMLECGGCHAGEALTDSALVSIDTVALHAVGTQSLLSGGRLGGALSGIDTPSLHGLHEVGAYLHHGQATTLSDAMNYAGGTLWLANQATVLSNGNPWAVYVATDNASEGGGGFFRGALGGVAAFIGDDGGEELQGVRFEGIDGGSVGGAARISVRYARQYHPGTATLRVNGVTQSISILRQEPDNGWQVSGWRWALAEVALLPGPVNEVEILRSNGDLIVNAILVSTAQDLAAASTHRQVLDLSSEDRLDLFAYLRQLDGRDASGVPIDAPPPPVSLAPSILSHPQSLTVAEGNAVQLSVTVAGTGPFGFSWTHNGQLVGNNSQTLTIAQAELSDIGEYRVVVSNSQGSADSGAAWLTVNPALSIVTDTLPTAYPGFVYQAQIQAAGGISSVEFALVGGALPAGLQFGADGSIAGVPHAPAQAALTIAASDASGSAQRTLLLRVGYADGSEPDGDLVLHYTFDEGIGGHIWDAAAAGSNHSTAVPWAHWVSDGRFGGAYGPADPSAIVQRFYPANQGDLDFDPLEDEFTISVWVRTNVLSGYHTNLGKDGDPPNWQVQYRLWGTSPVSTLQAVVGDQYGPGLATAQAAPLNDASWHMVTMVNAWSEAGWRTRLYYDGGALAHEFPTGAGGRLPYLLRVGDTSHGGNSWNGQLDDLRIYRRALLPAEIAALYTPEPPATPWLSALSPEEGHPGQQYVVDVTGSGFTPSSSFALGDVVLLDVVLVSPFLAHLHVHVPLGATPGLRSLEIHTEHGSAALEGAFGVVEQACAGVVCNSPPGPCFAPTGECQAISGECNYPQLAEGSACDHGVDCMEGAACDAMGQCGVPNHLRCNDGIHCTHDICDSEVGCTYEVSGLACENFDCPTGGDVNGSGHLSVADVACVLLVASAQLAAGPAPGCLYGEVALADVNCSGTVNVADVQLLISLTLSWSLPLAVDLDGNRCADACEACPMDCGDGICEQHESCALCASDCGGCPGACCSEHGGAGCEEATVQECVCSHAPGCCQPSADWDALCVGVAEEHCGLQCPPP